jgi:putative PIG3 family NAD(P)H quinone oxidoreductase
MDGTSMRIVNITRWGGPEVLQIAEHDTPVPAPGEVLIRIAAAGLNRADILQRKGNYPLPPGTVPWPGLEVSGTIAAIGSSVAEFAIGDRVCALLAGGGYADYCVAPVEQVLPIPGGLTFIEAASIPESAFTVWSNVFEFCHLAAGESLLVHGGSSGIGVMAIQLATALGNTVYATAGSADKCRACEKLGALRGINYRDEDFVAVIREATRSRGVDVVLDMVGGDYIGRDLECLAVAGRIVVIARQRDSRATVSLAHLMDKRAVLTGSTLRPRSIAFKGEIKQQLLKIVWPLIESGKVKPIVNRTFPLADAGAAQAYMDTGAHIGKIVLTR